LSEVLEIEAENEGEALIEARKYWIEFADALLAEQVADDDDIGLEVLKKPAVVGPIRVFWDETDIELVEKVEQVVEQEFEVEEVEIEEVEAAE
jgi:hypothetical protein